MELNLLYRYRLHPNHISTAIDVYEGYTGEGNKIIHNLTNQQEIITS